MANLLCLILLALTKLGILLVVVCLGVPVLFASGIAILAFMAERELREKEGAPDARAGFAHGLLTTLCRFKDFCQNRLKTIFQSACSRKTEREDLAGRLRRIADELEGMQGLVLFPGWDDAHATDEEMERAIEIRSAARAILAEDYRGEPIAPDASTRITKKSLAALLYYVADMACE